MGKRRGKKKSGGGNSEQGKSENSAVREESRVIDKVHSDAEPQESSTDEKNNLTRHQKKNEKMKKEKDEKANSVGVKSNASTPDTKQTPKKKAEPVEKVELKKQLPLIDKSEPKEIDDDPSWNNKCESLRKQGTASWRSEPRSTRLADPRMEREMSDFYKSNSSAPSFKNASRTDPQMERGMSDSYKSSSSAASLKNSRFPDPQMESKMQNSYKSNNSPSSSKNQSYYDNDRRASDKQFDIWDDTWKDITDFQRVHEMEGDLFAQPDEYALAHCVAEDLSMGSGIAVDFKQRFKKMPELMDQRARQGGLAFLQNGDRYIYYLVTKRVSNGKPTYYTLWRSLNAMKEHIMKKQVQKLAIPRLGCGLDRLEWSMVKSMLEFIFKDTNLEIRVCNFQQEENDEAATGGDVKKYTPRRTCFVKDFFGHIKNIEAGTAIFYFTTADGTVDDTMVKLASKYNYMSQFRQARLRLGTVVVFEDSLDYLFGCVVREHDKELFGFTAFGKCIAEFMRRQNQLKNDCFRYVAFQHVDPDVYHDDLINEKIQILLKNLCRNVEIYYCIGE